MLTPSVFGLCSVLALAVDPDTSPSAAPKPPVEFPHPLITEILYAVPKGDAGDANQDGKRSPTGDEFVELINPHDKPINLKGYVVCDALPLKGPDSDRPSKADKKPADGAPAGVAEKPKRSQVRFVFPDLTLQPGEIAVVFNGFESSIPGPVGDESAAAAKNDKFAGANVFTMRVKSSFASFANQGDCVALLAPDGRGVECVRWGTAAQDKKIPAASLVEEAPESSGSVQRVKPWGKFVSHRDLPGDAGKLACSPGTFEIKPGATTSDAAQPPAPTPVDTPAPAPKPAPKGKAKPKK